MIKDMTELVRASLASLFIQRYFKERDTLLGWTVFSVSISTLFLLVVFLFLPLLVVCCVRCCCKKRAAETDGGPPQPTFVWTHPCSRSKQLERNHSAHCSSADLEMASAGATGGGGIQTNLQIADTADEIVNGHNTGLVSRLITAMKCCSYL